MARPKKDGSYFSCFMQTELSEKLHQYAEEHGMTLTAVVERAVRQLLEKEAKTETAQKDQ